VATGKYLFTLQRIIVYKQGWAVQEECWAAKYGAIRLFLNVGKCLRFDMAFICITTAART